MPGDLDITPSNARRQSLRSRRNEAPIEVDEEGMDVEEAPIEVDEGGMDVNEGEVAKKLTREEQQLKNKEEKLGNANLSDNNCHCTYPCSIVCNCSGQNTKTYQFDESTRGQECSF